MDVRWNLFSQIREKILRSLIDYKWVRRKLAGHWEEWITDGLNIVWIQREESFWITKEQPAYCHGQPVKWEFYPRSKEEAWEIEARELEASFMEI